MCYKEKKESIRNDGASFDDFDVQLSEGSAPKGANEERMKDGGPRAYQVVREGLDKSKA